MNDAPTCPECHGSRVVLLVRPDDAEAVCRDCGSTRDPEADDE